MYWRGGFNPTYFGRATANLAIANIPGAYLATFVQAGWRITLVVQQLARRFGGAPRSRSYHARRAAARRGDALAVFFMLAWVLLVAAICFVMW